MRRLLLAGLLVAITGIGIAEIKEIWDAQPLGIDFLPLWTAARIGFEQPSLLYNFHFITGLQDWLLHHGYGQRPFAYPPTALFPVLPFAGLPFWWAYGIWTTLTGLLLLYAAWRLAPGPQRIAVVLLTLISTPVFTAALVGQTSFLVTALAALALWQVKRRPALAGALIGMAVLIKPQSLILAPIALAAAGHWRALTVATLTGAAGGLAGLLTFGLPAWLDWLTAIPRFQALVDGNAGLIRGTITPAGQAVGLGVEGPALWAFRGICLIAAAAIAWRVYRRTEDAGIRLAALLGGGLIAAPYAMHYDATLLAVPVALCLVATLDTRHWMRGLGAMLLMTGTGIPHIGGYCLTALVLLLVWPALGVYLPTFSRRHAAA